MNGYLEETGVYFGLDGSWCDTPKEKYRADESFKRLCAAPVTNKNIIDKSRSVDFAAGEISCLEFEGNEAMIQSLADQLYTYFDGDMEKAKSFYSTIGYHWCEGIKAIEDLSPKAWEQRREKRHVQRI